MPGDEPAGIDETGQFGHISTQSEDVSTQSSDSTSKLNQLHSNLHGFPEPRAMSSFIQNENDKTEPNHEQSDLDVTPVQLQDQSEDGSLDADDADKSGEVVVPLFSDPAYQGAAATVNILRHKQSHSSRSVRSARRKVEHHSLKVTSVIFKEATLDSPSFRASAAHTELQSKDITGWIVSLENKLSSLDEKVDVVKARVNDVISLFIPPFANQHILDSDYTDLAFRRYTEAFSSHWVKILSDSRQHARHFSRLSKNFIDGPHRTYEKCLASWVSAKANYDALTIEYMNLSPRADASEARAAAMQVFKTRKKYLILSLDFCDAMILFSVAANRLLADGMSHPYKMKEYASTNPDDFNIEADMQRLSAYGKELEILYKKSRKESLKAKEDCLAQIERSAPSKLDVDFDNNVEGMRGDPSSGFNEKFGWIFTKSASHNSRTKDWQRCWAFLKSGIFGWLVQASDQTFVQQSPKMSVLLMNITPVLLEDKRHCLMVRTLREQFYIQVESKLEMQSWLDVYETLKAENTDSEGLHDASAWISESKSLFFPVLPRAPEPSRNGSQLATKTLGNKQNPTVIIDQLIKTELNSSDAYDYVQTMFSNITEFIESPPEFAKSSALGLNASEISSLVPFSMSSMPLATAGSLEALLASTYFNPGKIPNAATANYLGSVNWLNYHIPNGPVYRNVHKPVYPQSYPEQLKYQDLDLRGIFGSSALAKDQNDLVVMVSRCFVEISANWYVPARIWVTPSTIFVYANWIGLIGTTKIDLETVKAIDCYPGKSHDEARIIFRDHGQNVSIGTRFFVDSGALSTKRLNFLAGNSKSSNPLSSQKCIQRLLQIGKDFEVEARETIKDMPTNQAQPGRHAKGPSSSKPVEEDVRIDDIDWVLSKLLENLPKNPKQGVHLNRRHIAPLIKLAHTHEFYCPPRILYAAVFGDRSGAFMFDQKSHSSLNRSPWTYKGEYVQRKVEISLEYNDPENEKVMRLTQYLGTVVDNAFYVIVELGGIVEVPRDSKFFTINWYVISQASHGDDSRSLLTTYSAIIWTADRSILVNFKDSAIRYRIQGRMNRLCLKVDEFVSKMTDPTSQLEAAQTFGRVRGSTMDDGSVAEENLIIRPATDFELLSYWALILSVAVSTRVMTFIRTLKNARQYIVTHNVIVLTLATSIVLNIIMLSSSGLTAWTSYWSVRNADNTLQNLKFHPVRGSAFKREIYSSEVQDAIRSHKLFEKDLLFQGSIATLGNNTCMSKFESILTYPADDNEFESFGKDVSTQKVMCEVHSIRTSLARQRNKLLTELHKLNGHEIDLLVEQWHYWVSQEAMKCSEVRQLLGEIEAPRNHLISHYCLDCYEIARRIL